MKYEYDFNYFSLNEYWSIVYPHLLNNLPFSNRLIYSPVGGGVNVCTLEYIWTLFYLIVLPCTNWY